MLRHKDLRVLPNSRDDSYPAMKSKASHADVRGAPPDHDSPAFQCERTKTRLRLENRDEAQPTHFRVSFELSAEGLESPAKEDQGEVRSLLKKNPNLDSV